MSLYLFGAAVVGLVAVAPGVVELGIWGAGQVLYGAYWLAWGRNETQRQEERLRDIIRQEIARSAAIRQQEATAVAESAYVTVMESEKLT